MENPFQGMGDRIAQRAAAHQQHVESCTKTPCDECERYACRKCSAAVSFPNSRCNACRDKSVREAWTRSCVEQVPQSFATTTLDAPWLMQLVGDNVIAAARKATSAERVIAVGPPGSGKTSLLAGMFVATSFTDGRPMWISAHQLAKSRAQHPLGEGEAPLVVRALDAEILVIDELGGEDQRYASAVTEVIFERHAQGAVTWITTGVTPKEIGDRYGGGIARRIFEGAEVFRLPGRKR